MSRLFSLTIQWTAVFVLTLAAMPPAIGQDFFQNPVVLTVEQGLPSDSIHVITRDRRGFVYIGTDEGLCRYDGATVETFSDRATLPEPFTTSRVYDVLEDTTSERMWVGTLSGLISWDPVTNHYDHFQADLEMQDSLPDNIIRDLYRDRQGILWISCWTRGLVRYWPEHRRFQRFEFEAPPAKEHLVGVNHTRINSIVAIAQDRKDEQVLWLASSAGLIRFNKASGSHELYYYEMADENLAYLGNSLKAIYIHSDGRIYLGSFDMAIVFDPVTETFSTIEMPEGKLEGGALREVAAICPRSDHELWITYSDGVILYNTRKKQCVFIKENDYASGYHYGAWMVDAQGRLWNGTERNGVFLYDPLRQQAETFPFDISGNNLLYIPRAVRESPDGKKLYICVEDGEGLYIFNRERGDWKIVRPPAASLTADKAFMGVDLAWSDGRLMVLSSNQLFRLSDDEQRLIPVPLPLGEGTFRFRRMLYDRRGNLWLTSRREGVYRIYADGRFDHYREALNDESGTNMYIWVEHIFEDSRGWIWIRRARSYCIYQPERDRFIKFPYYAGHSSNTYRYLQNFAEDQEGRVWIASMEDGLGYTMPDQPEAGIIRKFSEAEGLPDNKIISIASDRQGNIWMITGKGLVRVDTKDFSFKLFGQGYGLPVRGTNLFLLSTGEMVMAYERGGISLFHPDSLRTNQEMPRPYLTSFKVFDRELAGAFQLLDQEELRLSYRQNFFSLEFSSIAYTISQRNAFAYKLEGFDEDWTYAGSRRYAAYTNVPGGDYVFRLRAANNEGQWSNIDYALPIRISTPWWQTWIFRILLFLFMAGIGYGIYRYRVNNIRHEERLRSDFERKLANVEMSALRAQMNPHFIFNCLNSIDYYILKNETDKASDYLNRFSRLIRLILQNSSANYVNLKDELEALKLYMEMESLRFDNKFRYEVCVARGLDLDGVEIPPMLFQPYVENAIWHGLMHKAGVGKVSLTLSRDDNVLHCIIQDDGIGREEAQRLKSKGSVRKKSMGMRITSDRIELINRLYDSHTKVRVIDLKDDKGKALGTRVELDIPL